MAKGYPNFVSLPNHFHFLILSAIIVPYVAVQSFPEEIAAFFIEMLDHCSQTGRGSSSNLQVLILYCYSRGEIVKVPLFDSGVLLSIEEFKLLFDFLQQMWGGAFRVHLKNEATSVLMK